MIRQTYPVCQGLTAVRGIRSGLRINHHNIGHLSRFMQNKFSDDRRELHLFLTHKSNILLF